MSTGCVHCFEWRVRATHVLDFCFSRSVQTPACRKEVKPEHVDFEFLVLDNDRRAIWHGESFFACFVRKWLSRANDSVA